MGEHGEGGEGGRVTGSGGAAGGAGIAVVVRLAVALVRPPVGGAGHRAQGD